jgi:hypothetical protein
MEPRFVADGRGLLRVMSYSHDTYPEAEDHHVADDRRVEQLRATPALHELTPRTSTGRSRSTPSMITFSGHRCSSANSVLARVSTVPTSSRHR